MRLHGLVTSPVMLLHLSMRCYGPIRCVPLFDALVALLGDIFVPCLHLITPHSYPRTS